jgi:hypothetical protein
MTMPPQLPDSPTELKALWFDHELLKQQASAWQEQIIQKLNALGQVPPELEEPAPEPEPAPKPVHNGRVTKARAKKEPAV